MIAPHFARQQLLGLAVVKATEILAQPIDRVEVRTDTILVWAGSKRLTLEYSYSGGPTLGAGDWFIHPRGVEDVRPLALMTRLRKRLCGRWASA